MENLVRAALALLQFAKKYNVPPPVLTVSPAFYDAVRHVSLGEQDADLKQTVATIKVEVDYDRIWRK